MIRANGNVEDRQAYGRDAQPFREFCKMKLAGLLLVGFALCAGTSLPVQSRDGWEGRPLVCDPAVMQNGPRLQLCQDWIATVKQPDTRISCCGDGDAFMADDFQVGPHGEYYAVITGDYPKEQSTYPDTPKPITRGSKILIPPNKLNRAQEDGGNPSGHGVVFIGRSGEVLCYFGPTLS